MEAPIDNDEKISGSFIDVLDEECSSLQSVNVPFGATADKVLQYYLENRLHTDVTFQVRCGDGYVCFPCHKLVLSIWSPVFAGIFFRNESITENVEITKMPPSAFEVMIKYCYGIETELQKYRDDINFLLKLYKGAKEYRIKGLQVLCCEFFSCALPTKDNVFELLDAASFIGSECLKHRCYKVVQTHTQEIIQSRDLCSINRSMINTILEMSALSLKSENELITWMFEWGTQESAKHEDITLREIMNPFLPRLNFLSLKPKEFGLLVTKHKDFFDEKEGFAIFMNIVCLKSWPLPPWFGKEFNRSFVDSEN